MVIELNPDGSGVFKRSMNFDRASEEQKDKIRSLFNMSDNGFSSELLNIEDNFPEPFFTIIKHDIDKQNLSTYTEIAFQDINRLFAVDKKVSGLEGVSFEIDKSNIIFSVKRNIESEVKNSLPKELNPFSNLTAKVTNTFISKSNDEKIETFYEFIGDDKNVVVNWQSKLEIPNHSITKSKIKQNFAKYPVLKPANSEIKTATWIVSNDKSKNSLELDLLVPKPDSKDRIYLGYDEKYLLSGKYNDGKELSLNEIRFKSFTNFKSFSDSFVNEGGGKFNLPLKLSFPEKPVEFLDSLMVRIRVISVKNTKRLELGKPVKGKTYEADSFKFTIEHTEKNINITNNGPSHLFKQYLIKTPNGNILPEKPMFAQNNTSKFKNIPLIQNSIFFAEYYTGTEHQWLDSKAPRLDFSKSNSLEPVETFSLQKLFPEIKNFPVVDESIYKDLDSFKSYWGVLADNQVIPALLVVSNSFDNFKNNRDIYSWYQSKLGDSLKQRQDFFENNKDTLADYMFRLFLNKPNQNDNTAILYCLSNLRLTDTIKEKAVNAIKEDKLKKGINIIFWNKISDEERDILKVVFYKTAHDWVQNKSIFEVLTKGNNPDLALAREVSNSDNYHEFVRNSAFEIILDRDKNITSEFIKPLIINPETRRSAIQVINSRLDRYHSRDEITSEDLIALITPLETLFEDIMKLSNDYDAKNVNTILDAINSVKVEPVQ